VLPILFKIGPLTIRTYGLLLAVGFALAVSLAMRRARRRGMNPETILDLCFYLILAGIVGSRLLYVIQFPSWYLSNPLRILMIWEGGLVFYGGLIAALVVGALYVNRRRIDFLETADVLAPAISLGQAIGRLGCFAAGCCFGLPWEGGWCAVTFANPDSLAPLHIPLHPVQLYQSAADFGVLALLLLADRHRRFKGQTLLTYFLVSPAARFVIEFFRGDERGAFFDIGLSPAQGTALLMMAVAAVAWAILSRRHSTVDGRDARG
jgi:phosphatidylglycerol:prolipoprotein diacylglycerol transferase